MREMPKTVKDLLGHLGMDELDELWQLSKANEADHGYAAAAIAPLAQSATQALDDMWSAERRAVAMLGQLADAVAFERGKGGDSKMVRSGGAVVSHAARYQELIAEGEQAKMRYLLVAKPLAALLGLPWQD